MLLHSNPPIGLYPVARAGRPRWPGRPIGPQVAVRTRAPLPVLERLSGAAQAVLSNRLEGEVHNIASSQRNR